MDAIGGLGLDASLVLEAQAIAISIVETYKRISFVLREYGIAGTWLVMFGSHDVLRSEFQVLASGDDQVAFDFKKATQDESNMIAIAVRRSSFPNLTFLFLTKFG